MNVTRDLGIWSPAKKIQISPSSLIKPHKHSALSWSQKKSLIKAVSESFNQGHPLFIQSKETKELKAEKVSRHPFKISNQQAEKVEKIYCTTYTLADWCDPALTFTVRVYGLES